MLMAHGKRRSVEDMRDRHIYRGLNNFEDSIDEGGTYKDSHGHTTGYYRRGGGTQDMESTKNVLLNYVVKHGDISKRH